MKDKKFIYSILSLEKEEGLLVSLLVVYSFFAGASLAFFVTSSTALFLNHYNRDMLSLAFIAAGIIVWLIGQAYSKVQKNYAFTTSIKGTVAFLLVSIIVFVAFFIGSASLKIIFIIYAWIRVFAYIHAVTFWGMAGRLFTLRQGKRLFGLISGGEVIASIVSFFSVPFLLRMISTEDLLLISGVALFLGFLVLLVIVKRFGDKLGKPTNVKRKTIDNKSIKKTSFLQNRYYKLFFIIAFLPIFAQFFVDFVFQAQAKLEYPNKDELTAFVGVFFGISSIVEFFLKTFLSGRLLSKYGMRFGLLSFPLMLAFSFVLATAFGFIYGAASLFFSFVALGRLFTRAVRTSFNDPATQILYQPLPDDERIAFQNKVESGPKAYASIIAGIFLFLFAKIPGFNLVHFSAFLLVIIIIWYKSGTSIYKEYRDVLQSILSKKHKNRQLLNNEMPQLKLLANGLTSAKTKSIESLLRFFRLILPYETDNLIRESEALSKFSVADKSLKFSSVIELSKSENSADRIKAARNMTGYSIYKVEKPLIRLLHDDDFEVKCETIIACGKMKESELFPHLVSLFQNPVYKDTVSASMMNIGEAIVAELDHFFQKTEYDPVSQIKTVELIEKIGGNNSVEFLKKNIKHQNKLVSDRIIKALGTLNFQAGRKESSFIWQRLENEIKNYVAVSSALINIGESRINTNLYQSLEIELEEKWKKIFWHLSVLYDPQAIRLIAESLESKDVNAAGFALEVADMILSEMHKELLLPLFESRDKYELVQKYNAYFPSEKIEQELQLADVIYSEYWVNGYYTKCCALKLLADTNSKLLKKILVANIMHPNEMIRQLTGYILYQKYPELFFREVQLNAPKLPELKEFSEKIELYDLGSKQLIFDKLQLIKQLNYFSSIPEEQLIEIATSANFIQCQTDELIDIELNTTNFFMLASGELLNGNSGKILKKGALFCPYLSAENNMSDIRVKTDKALIINFKLHFITELFMKNTHFAEEIQKSLWMPEEPETKIEKIPAGMENVK